jgi:hypothetical protein
VTDLSRTRARLPLHTFVAVFILAKCARVLIWLAVRNHRSDGPLRRVIHRVIAFAERLAGVTD